MGVFRKFAIVALAAALTGCAGLTSDVDETEASDDEIASSMGADGGASMAVGEILAESTGIDALAAQIAPAAAKSTTVTIVAGTGTISVTYYDGYGGTGTALGTTPGEVPDGALSAVVESERTYSISGDVREGTTTITAQVIVDDIATTVGTWTLDGSLSITRSITLASGATVESEIEHTIDWVLSAADGSINDGGEATTTATVSVNGRAARERTYTWTFNGDGTATLTTSRGTSVEVTVE